MPDAAARRYEIASRGSGSQLRERALLSCAQPGNLPHLDLPGRYTPLLFRDPAPLPRQNSTAQMRTSRRLAAADHGPRTPPDIVPLQLLCARGAILRAVRFVPSHHHAGCAHIRVARRLDDRTGRDWHSSRAQRFHRRPRGRSVREPIHEYFGKHCAAAAPRDVRVPPRNHRLRAFSDGRLLTGTWSLIC